MGFLPWPSLFVAFVLAFPMVASDDVNHSKALVEWLRSRKGYFNSKLEIRKAENHPNSGFGIFAKDNIQRKELLFSIPRHCLISSGKPGIGDVVQANYEGRGEWHLGRVMSTNANGTYNVLYADGDEESGIDSHHVIKKDTGAMPCHTIRALIQQIELGDDSEFAPYINYLLSQSTGQLPTSWSKAGKDLLMDILGVDVHGQALPPEDIFSWSFKNECDGTGHPFEEFVALLVVQRGWDDILLPVYDMMRHRNGHWLNTESDPVHGDGDFRVRALRNIQAGEELFTTYNFCIDCGGRAHVYGTPEIFRDYGFVEQYPQRWIFHNQEVGFDLDQMIDGDGSAFGKLDVSWLSQEPSADTVGFLLEQLRRLKNLAEYELESPYEVMADREWDAIRQYHEALMIAITNGLEAILGNDTHKCVLGDSSCEIVSDMYDDIENVNDEWDFKVEICNHDDMMSFSGYDVIEEVKSPYQEISFFHDNKTKDTCFDLDNTVQICGSYRPHYHEMVVHYAARFLDNIKRVVWVGGGDSMLLHEIVKYPNLELVVGLELDQKVTRHSFKHFGTQPHWDNEKVQWWYGDATKSLLMLPKEYFGTFDLVLVDLSETVMSALVTDELDVMEAFALLLKPEGIFVKNELYLEKMSQVFDYTVQIHFYDVPVLCSQALVFGSNKVDFLARRPKDHNIANLFIEPLADIDDHYQLFHDYRRRNHHGVRLHCNHHGEENPIKQTTSPGILMIVEAEDATGTLQTVSEVVDTFVKVLESKGLAVITTVAPASEGKRAVVVVILREGYVVARTWPEHKYCAYDIHLWSSFEKQDDVRKALIESVGSNLGSSSSSFRVVAGGMFGINTWKDDEKNRGPEKTTLCNPEISEPFHTMMLDPEVADTILEESISLIHDEVLMVIVICGDPSQPCRSLDVLKKHSRVQEVVGLWTCATLIERHNNTKDELESMHLCENDIIVTLRQAVSEEKKARAIIVDLSATMPMAQIFYKILRGRLNRKRFLTSDIMVMATMLGTDEMWRWGLLQRIHWDIVAFEPLYSAELVFNGSDSNIVMCVTSSGDPHFMLHLVGMQASIEEKTGLVSEVRDIQGGVFTYMPGFVPSQFFLPDAYDQTSPLEQWKSQQPLGYQTIVQLETQKTENVGVGDKIKGNYQGEGTWFDGIVVSANFADETFDILYDDGDEEYAVRSSNVIKRDISGEQVSEAALSAMQIKHALQSALELMKCETIPSPDIAEFTNVGSGSVLVVNWIGGNIIVLWDGKKHVDINLFTYNENVEAATEFVDHFKAQIPKLKVVLRDEQPRGTGRVVNFVRDINPRVNPHWL